jgi:cleavage stimulation factor subunit 3
MEYHCSNEKSVSSRIFEKGLDLFSGEVDFVLRYLGFLISINDENSKSSEYSVPLLAITY